MLKFETMDVSISACPYGHADKSGKIIMVGSIACAHCDMYKSKGSYKNTIICKAEEGRK